MTNGALVNPEASTVNATPPASALHEAARNGYLDIVDYLLRNGAKVNADAPPYDMVPHPIERIMFLLLQSRSPLQLAARAGHYLVVRRLLQAGAAVDRYKHAHRPLVFACERGHWLAAKELLESGARVDEVALEAAKKDSLRMVQLLKSYNRHQGSTDVEDKGPTMDRQMWKPRA